MAIQRVKGAPRTAYVIKGESKPQSYGQAWAQMVAQNKYKLWEEAQREAMRQMKLEEQDYQTQVKYQQQMRDDLRKQIDQSRRNIDKLSTKQVEAASDVSRFEAGGGTRGSSSRILKSDSDLTILEKVARDRRISKDSAWKEYNFFLRENQRIEKEAAKLDASPNPMEKKKAEALRSTKYTEADMRTAKDNYETALDNYETAQLNLNKTPAEQSELAKPYRQRQSTVGGTKGTERGTYEAPDYQSLMDENQAKIDRLTAELQGLEAPTRPEGGSLIERTRGVYRSELEPSSRMPVSSIVERLRRPSTPVSDVPTTPVEPVMERTVESRPTVSPERQAEMDMLGIDFVDQYLGVPSQPTELTETPNFMRTSTMDPELAGEQARDRLEREYQPSPLTRVIEGYSGEQFDVANQASLRERSPTFEDVMQDRQAQIENEIIQTKLAQEEGRAEAEAQRALVPSPIQEEPMTEGQRRSAITAPMVQNIPRRDQSMRQMEMEALGLELPPVLEEAPPQSPAQFKMKMPPTIKYKSEVYGKGLKMPREEVNKTRSMENKPEWAKLTEGLFNPPPKATQEKIDELLNNAWEQITLTYSEDRDTMKKAHSYLIALDNNLEIKPE